MWEGWKGGRKECRRMEGREGGRNVEGWKEGRNGEGWKEGKERGRERSTRNRKHLTDIL